MVEWVRQIRKGKDADPAGVFPRPIQRQGKPRQDHRMNYGKTLFNILAAAMGMVIAITGLCFKTGYFETSHPALGYVLIGLGLFVTIFYLGKLRS